jgi:hypothetical protein
VSTHPFEKEFDRVIDAFDRSARESKRRFIDAARVRAADAIIELGEEAVREERTLHYLRYARKHFVDRAGHEYPTRLASVLAAAEELRSTAMHEATFVRDGDDFSNGVNQARLSALVAAVRSLESLSQHESIAVG